MLHVMFEFVSFTETCHFRRVSSESSTPWSCFRVIQNLTGELEHHHPHKKPRLLFAQLSYQEHRTSVLPDVSSGGTVETSAHRSNDTLHVYFCDTVRSGNHESDENRPSCIYAVPLGTERDTLHQPRKCVSNFFFEKLCYITIHVLLLLRHKARGENALLLGVSNTYKVHRKPI